MMRTTLMAAGLLAAACFMGACTVTRIDFDHMTPAEFQQKPDYMTILPSVPKGATVIGPVKVELCQKTQKDPDFSEEDVYRALKREAARQGGTALAGVSSKMITSGIRRCLKEASASGTAYVRSK